MNQQADEARALLTMKNKESQDLKIISDILEPQAISDPSTGGGTATFHIRREGVLSNGSRLVVPLYASNATTRLTAYGGVYGVIKNATLRTSSGTVIAQSTDINYLMSIRNHWVSQDVRERRGQFVNGTYNIWDYGQDTVSTLNGKYILQNSGGDQEARYKLGQTPADAVGYTIKLSELFPSLFPFTVPVFLLDDYLILFIEFSANGNTGERAVGSNGNGGIGNVLVDTANCKFVADHLIYAPAVMNNLRSMTQQKNGLVNAYGDYNTINLTHIGGTGVLANQKIGKTFRNSIGLSGLTIKHFLIHNSVATANQQPANSQLIAGKYASQDSYAGADGQELQLVINNQNYYPQNVSSNDFFKELEDVYGVAPHIPYPVYNTMGGVGDDKDPVLDQNTIFGNRCLITSAQMYGASQNNLLGTGNILGVNFTWNRKEHNGDGMKIGLTPVEIRYTRQFTNGNNGDDNLNTRVFACVERVMAIKNGRIFNNYS